MRSPEKERDDADRDLQNAINAARIVARGAQRDFGDFASMHEAYGVLAEEACRNLREAETTKQGGLFDAVNA